MHVVRTRWQVRRECGSFDKYVWGFVNHKPITTEYKTCQRIPAKTSKSETMSKDMVRRGFRYVGPTIVHSFMQAAGLTNDHLISCPRRLQLQCHWLQILVLHAAINIKKGEGIGRTLTKMEQDLWAIVHDHHTSERQEETKKMTG